MKELTNTKQLTPRHDTFAVLQFESVRDPRYPEPEYASTVRTKITTFESQAELEAWLTENRNERVEVVVMRAIPVRQRATVEFG